MTLMPVFCREINDWKIIHDAVLAGFWLLVSG
jgi:hypothetical protein